MRVKLSEKLLKTLCPAAKPFEVVDETLPGFLVRVQPTGAMTFYLSYRTATRQRKRIKLGQYGAITLTQAKELAKQYLGEVARGHDPQEDKKAMIQQSIRDKAGTLGVFIANEYAPWVLSHQKSASHTLMLLEKCFAHLHHRQMEDITCNLIEKWQLSELKRGIKPSTINRSLNALRGVLTRAVKQGVLTEHPLKQLRKVQEDGKLRVRFLSPDELERLLTTLSNRNQRIIQERRSYNAWLKERGRPLLPEILDHQFGDHINPLVLLALNTGLRRGELLKLEWKSINLETERPVLTVKADTAKSNRDRHIQLNQTARKVLSVWKAQNEPANGLVFPAPNGDSFKSIKTAWLNIVQEAEIHDFRFHDIRHHFASILVMKRIPLNTVRQLLGHSDMVTTLRYAHLDDDHMAEAVALLDEAGS